MIKKCKVKHKAKTHATKTKTKTVGKTKKTLTARVKKEYQVVLTFAGCPCKPGVSMELNLSK